MVSIVSLHLIFQFNKILIFIPKYLIFVLISLCYQHCYLKDLCEILIELINDNDKRLCNKID